MSGDDRSRQETLHEAWRHLDEGDVEAATASALWLVGRDATEPEGLYLAGMALMAGDRVDEAESHLRQVLRADPAHIGAREALATLFYETCRFDECRAEVEAVLEAEPENPQAHYLSSLLAERRGEYARAEEAERMAHRLDPDRYALPPRFTRQEFESYVQGAVKELPGEFRERMDNLAVVVEEVPSEKLLETMEEPTPDLLGLFVGTPLPHKSMADLPSAPDAIYLFKRNLERLCEDQEQLVEEIRITLLHEVGHFLGLDEDQLSRRGYE